MTHQPGVYVPLRALFLVCNGNDNIAIVMVMVMITFP